MVKTYLSAQFCKRLHALGGGVRGDCRNVSDGSRAFGGVEDKLGACLGGVRV